ncbi:RDD family protein [Actinophytocola sediminis]
MTAPIPGQSRPHIPQDSVNALAAQVVGPRAAKRLAAFRDGVLYVKAREWTLLLAWLVDFVVFVLVAGIGVLVLAGVDNSANLQNGVLVSVLLGILFLVPMLYGGLCYRNGRALGAVLTGTQLVRYANGGRIGAKAPWAMLVRTLLMPVLFFIVIAGALTGGGSAPGGSLVRVGVDATATRQLRAAGIT